MEGDHLHDPEAFLARQETTKYSEERSSRSVRALRIVGLRSH